MNSPMRAERLRTEFLVEPIGIDETSPRLFWWAKDDRQDAAQTAYRIRAATTKQKLASNAPDLHDTGKVMSKQNAHVTIPLMLSSRQRVWWDVQLWDAQGAAGPASEASFFEMGLLQASDWQAKWIASPLMGAGQTMPPVPILRNEFYLPAEVTSARLYITALGLYEAHLNGERVSDDYFRPGWTDYFDRLQYQTYDVTARLKVGANAMAVLLGDGWYAGRVAHLERSLRWGDRPALLAQLEVHCADGSTHRIATGDGWTWTQSPILGADLLQGEEYDARRELKNWNNVAAAGDWRAVEIVSPRHGKLVAQPNEPVRLVKEFVPVADPTDVFGGWERTARVFDFGQNIAGMVRLKVKGPAGATVKLRFAEILQKNGQLYTENLRSARVTDTYTLRGDPEGETWTPRFTFHGFRYCELSAATAFTKGKDQPVKLELGDRSCVTALALMSATPVTGEFECDHALLNQLQSNIQWGQRGNFLEAPTDCPQRDERLGWTGDAQVFAPTAAFNMDVAAFFTKWSRDLDDAQDEAGNVPCVAPVINILEGDSGPGWSDARVIVPWSMYQAYGDQRLLERHYEPMKKWTNALAAMCNDGIRCDHTHKGFRGFGDWLNLENGTPIEILGTAYFAHSTGIMAKVAALLDRPEDAAHFAQLRSRSVDAFNREFVSPAGKLTSPTQTAYLMALGFDLLPESKRDRALGELIKLFEAKQFHLATGFLGTPLICPVLTRFGRIDLAYKILLQTTYPGWLFPVSNGATTMWERWNSWTPDSGFGDANMNSFNHYAYGAVGQWMYAKIGGIELDPERPAYEHIRIAPQPGGPIKRARTALDSVRGRIESSWTLMGERFSLQVLIPPGCTATVRLPDGSVHERGSGRHAFEAGFVSA
jgi:alpha-L-rhamnosidase